MNNTQKEGANSVFLGKRRIVRYGENSYAIVIPLAFIETRMLHLNQEVEVEVRT